MRGIRLFSRTACVSVLCVMAFASVPAVASAAATQTTVSATPATGSTPWIIKVTQGPGAGSNGGISYGGGAADEIAIQTGTAVVAGANCRSAGGGLAYCKHQVNNTIASVILNDKADYFFTQIPAWIDGGSGRDIITGSGQGDVISGGIGNDDVYGGGGNDTIAGTDGDDHIWGDGGQNSITGGAGVDKIFTNNGMKDTVDCGTQVDTATVDRQLFAPTLPFDVLTSCDNVILKP